MSIRAVRTWDRKVATRGLFAGAVGSSSSVWTLCRGPTRRDLRMAAGRRPGSKREPRKSPTALDTCPCVCQPSGEDPPGVGSLPQADGRTREGTWAPVQKCFIWRSKFCTIGPPLSFCIVCVCACFLFLFSFFFFFPPKALLFFPHSALPSHPCFYSSCWGEGERKIYVEFLDETKQNETKNTCAFCSG